MKPFLIPGDEIQVDSLKNDSDRQLIEGDVVVYRDPYLEGNWIVHRIIKMDDLIELKGDSAPVSEMIELGSVFGRVRSFRKKKSAAIHYLKQSRLDGWIASLSLRSLSVPAFRKLSKLIGLVRRLSA